MLNSEPRYVSYVVVDAHTGAVHSIHPTRRAAKSAKDAARDHALRVRGGKPAKHMPFWQRLLLGAGGR